MRDELFKLTIKSHFVAAVKLPGYNGPCGRLHGHTYKVKVTVVTNKLNKDGMIIDHYKLQEKLNETLSVLDHNYLNDLEHFKTSPPTSENIAKYIFEKMCIALAKEDAILKQVKIAENENVSISYSK